MGVRVVLTWLDHNGRQVGAYFKQWGSPEFQVPYLARWAHDVTAAGERPCAENYLRTAFTDERLDLPVEPTTKASDHGDLDYRYTVQANWQGGLRVQIADRDSSDQWVPILTVEGLAELYGAAISLTDKMAKRCRQLIARDGEGIRQVMPDPDDLDEQVAEFSGWLAELAAPASTGGPNS